jgi:large subunit ribosomal protein L7/L12
MFELQQVERINGTTIGPVARRFGAAELGQGLARVVPSLLGGATQTGRQLRLLTAGDPAIEVIKLLREFTGLGLREAKAIVDGVPSDVPIGAMDDTKLRDFVRQLRALGARTELLNGGATRPLPRLRGLATAEVKRRSLLLIASMALPELDEVGRKPDDSVLEEVVAKLAEVIADPATKPDALREVIVTLLRRLPG